MMSIRSIFTVVMVGLASTLAVASAAALPAAASPAVHASVSGTVRASHAHALADDVVCPYHSGHWTAWYGTCATSTDHSCSAGVKGNMTPPNYVSNACANNVDLYPSANQGGTPLCIAHDSRTHHLATYRSWRVITGGC
jgi:hypothetical protein